MEGLSRQHSRHPASKCSNIVQKKLRRIVTAQPEPFPHGLREKRTARKRPRYMTKSHFLTFAIVREGSGGKGPQARPARSVKQGYAKGAPPAPCLVLRMSQNRAALLHPSQPPFKSPDGEFCYLFHQGCLIKRQVRGNVAPDASQLFPRRVTLFLITTHRKRRNCALPRPKKTAFGQISLHKFGGALFGTLDRLLNRVKDA